MSRNVEIKSENYENLDGTLYDENSRKEIFDNE